MVSFEDVQEVVLDEDDNTFTVVRNNGRAHTYNIDAERDFLNNILIGSERGEVNLFVLSSQNVDDYGNRFYEEY